MVQQSRFHSVFRTGIVTLALVASGGTLGAQTQGVFYHTPVSPGAPDMNAAYSTTPYCTTNVGGSSSGFSLDFSQVSTQNALALACPGTSASDFQHNFAVQFTGSLIAPSTGNYTLTYNSDDGTNLHVNGASVFSDYVEQGGGPGSITIPLNAGANPFVLDYFENSFGGAFVTMQLPEDITVNPPPVTTTPEPASLALVVTGMAGVFGSARRFRRL